MMNCPSGELATRRRGRPTKHQWTGPRIRNLLRLYLATDLPVNDIIRVIGEPDGFDPPIRLVQYVLHALLANSSKNTPPSSYYTVGRGSRGKPGRVKKSYEVDRPRGISRQRIGFLRQLKHNGLSRHSCKDTPQPGLSPRDVSILGTRACVTENDCVTPQPLALHRARQLYYEAVQRSEATGLFSIAATELCRNSPSVLPFLVDIIQQDVQRFTMAHCSIRRIPESICLCSRLRSLDLRANNLDLFPESLLEIEGLESLYLSRNSIRTLPESIQRLSRLRYLSVKRNFIRELPLSIGFMASLDTLRFGHNPIVCSRSRFKTALKGIRTKLEMIKPTPSRREMSKVFTYRIKEVLQTADVTFFLPETSERPTGGESLVAEQDQRKPTGDSSNLHAADETFPMDDDLFDWPLPPTTSDENSSLASPFGHSVADVQDRRDVQCDSLIIDETPQECNEDKADFLGENTSAGSVSQADDSFDRNK
ncbi:hypothetical protein BDY21DRAFT_425240, partial [Lineolata rhizophorae]